MGCLLILQKLKNWNWSLAWSGTITSSRYFFSGWKDYLFAFHIVLLLHWRREANKPDITVIILERNGIPGVLSREQRTRSSKGVWYQCHNWYKEQHPEDAYTIVISLDGSWTCSAGCRSCQWMGRWNRALGLSHVAKWKGWCHDSQAWVLAFDGHHAPGSLHALLAAAVHTLKTDRQRRIMKNYELSPKNYGSFGQNWPEQQEVTLVKHLS